MRQWSLARVRLMEVVPPKSTKKGKMKPGRSGNQQISKLKLKTVESQHCGLPSSQRQATMAVPSTSSATRTHFTHDIWVLLSHQACVMQKMRCYSI